MAQREMWTLELSCAEIQLDAKFVRDHNGRGSCRSGPLRRIEHFTGPVNAVVVATLIAPGGCRAIDKTPADDPRPCWPAETVKESNESPPARHWGMARVQGTFDQERNASCSA